MDQLVASERTGKASVGGPAKIIGCERYKATGPEREDLSLKTIPDLQHIHMCM